MRASPDFGVQVSPSRPRTVGEGIDLSTWFRPENLRSSLYAAIGAADERARRAESWPSGDLDRIGADEACGDIFVRFCRVGQRIAVQGGSGWKGCCILCFPFFQANQQSPTSKDCHAVKTLFAMGVNSVATSMSFTAVVRRLSSKQLSGHL